MQDSQGPIADRTREHLGPTDIGILHFRKLMMDAARDLAAGARSRRRRPAPIATPCARAPAVTHRSKDLAAVMTERFGDPAGFVGAPDAAQRLRA